MMVYKVLNEHDTDMLVLLIVLLSTYGTFLQTSSNDLPGYFLDLLWKLTLSRIKLIMFQ